MSIDLIEMLKNRIAEIESKLEDVKLDQDKARRCKLEGSLNANLAQNKEMLAIENLNRKVSIHEYE